MQCYTVSVSKIDVDRYCIRPLVLRDVSSVDLSTTVLGTKISYPVCVSPTGMHCMAHPDGEKATARGTLSNPLMPIDTYLRNKALSCF